MEALKSLGQQCISGFAGTAADGSATLPRQLVRLH